MKNAYYIKPVPNIELTYYLVIDSDFIEALNRAPGILNFCIIENQALTKVGPSIEVVIRLDPRYSVANEALSIFQAYLDEITHVGDLSAFKE